MQKSKSIIFTGTMVLISGALAPGASAAAKPASKPESVAVSYDVSCCDQVNYFGTSRN